jgi:hypothetical protein
VGGLLDSTRYRTWSRKKVAFAQRDVRDREVEVGDARDEDQRDEDDPGLRGSDPGGRRLGSAGSRGHVDSLDPAAGRRIALSG